jgi:dTDP-D-glucose 4,6-dehydratase
LRYFTVYGPRQREDMFIQRLLPATARGQGVRIYGDGQQRRDFTYIHDAITAASTYLPNCLINIGAGSGATLRDVVEYARQLTQHLVPIHTEGARSGDVPATCADRSTARRLLGWTPATDLVTGMAAQLDWLTATSCSPLRGSTPSIRRAASYCSGVSAVPGVTPTSPRPSPIYTAGRARRPAGSIGGRVLARGDTAGTEH